MKKKIERGRPKVEPAFRITLRIAKRFEKKAIPEIDLIKIKYAPKKIKQ